MSASAESERYPAGDLFSRTPLVIAEQTLRLRVTDELGESLLLRRFFAFHRANPHVYRHLERLALRLRARGAPHYGIKALFEGLRWEIALGQITDIGDGLKLNNNHTAYYARLLELHHPELAGWFRSRTLGPRAQVV